MDLEESRFRATWKRFLEVESRPQLFFSRCLPQATYHFGGYELLDVPTGL